MQYHIELDLDFRRNPYKEKYIVIEGIDGSGKTTQVGQLKAYFEKQGREVVVTKEPTREGEIGKLIHRILQAEVEVPSVALQYLYSADRTVNHATWIEPALKAGKVVISDRCFWSAIPYGIVDRGNVNFENTAKVLMVSQGILSLYNQFIVPDVTLYLDIAVDVAVERLLRMGKTHEIYEKKEKLEQIKKGYLWLIEHFPKEFIRIDGVQDVDKVTEEILKHVSSIM